MKKIFNFRPLFLAFVGVFLGAYFSVDILFGTSLLKILIGLAVFILFCLAFTNINFFKVRKIAIIVLVVSLCFGFGASIFAVQNHNSKQLNENIEVSGIVSDKIIQHDSYSTIILRNISSKDEKISGKLKLTIFYYDGIDINCGDKLSFKANVNSYKIVTHNGQVNSYSDKTNIAYYASANLEDIKVVDGKPNFFENIRVKSRSLILKATSNDDIGNLIYSVMFGDKTYLSQDINNSFKKSGAAHLLAVSGLHVGFIVVLLLLIFRLFKIKKLVKITTIAIFLLLYNFICGFSASIVRASLMIMLLLLAQFFGEKSDGITALGIAGLAILLVKPLMAFDLGFQLSFSSVLGILTLARPLEKYFNKIRIPTVISSAFAVSVAATIGTLPFLGIAFGEFAYIGLISNLILIPVFGIVYSFSFVIFFVVLIIPATFKLLVASEMCFKFIVKICDIFAVVSSFNITKICYLLLIIYPVIMLIGSYSLLPDKTKTIVGKMFTIFICACISFCFITPNIKVLSATKLDSDALIISNPVSNEVLIVSQSFDKREVENAMNFIYRQNYKKLLNGVLVTGTAEDVKEVYEFARENKNVQVYLTINSYLDELEIIKYDNIKILVDVYKAGDFKLEAHYCEGYVCAVNIEIENKNVLVLNSLNSAQVGQLNEQISFVDVIVCNKFKKCYNNFSIKFNYFLASTAQDEVKLEVKLTNKSHSQIAKI